MGTSTSFRAPQVPRWQAFTTALETGQRLERVRAELFNAGDEWAEALSAPSIAAFAVAAADARDALAPRLAAAERPAEVLQAYVAEARAASARVAGSSALALAERALVAYLARSSAGDVSLAQQTGRAAAEHLGAALTEPGAATIGYLREVLSQYARHVVAREAGRLTEQREPASVSDVRMTVRRLAAEADSIGAEVAAPFGEANAIREAWAGLVHEAFDRGSRIEVERR